MGLGTFASGRRGWGVATHGTVTPDVWPDPLVLRQSGVGYVYHGVNGDEVKYTLNGDDTQAQLLDEAPPHIYYMDYPGMRFTGDEGVHRIRANFGSVVRMGEPGGRVCSNTLEWSTAQSWHRVDTDFLTFTDPQVATTPGDNQLWVGRQLSAAERDWDMQ